MRFGRNFKAIEIPEDTRPLGSVNWADPCTAGMTERINTFNPEGYHSPGSTGEQTGIRSGPGINSSSAATWHEQEQFRASNRRKGFGEEDEA